MRASIPRLPIIDDFDVNRKIMIPNVYDAKPPSGRAVVPLPPLVIVVLVVLRAARTNSNGDNNGRGGEWMMMVSIIISSLVSR